MGKAVHTRAKFILAHLSYEDKAHFLENLLYVSLVGDKKEIVECILDWEETASINSDPSRKKKILARCKSLDVLLHKNHNS